jgi:hypothetical protein
MDRAIDIQPIFALERERRYCGCKLAPPGCNSLVEKYTPEVSEGVKFPGPVLHSLEFELFNAAAEEFQDQE